MSERITFTVDGREVEADPGQLIIDACQQAGVYIPRFCHHERMNPVGMCRMCIVEVDTGRGPALQPSCMLTVADGMTVDTESEVTKKAQDGVLEFLLINHPLDCPVCDKGGECPLQDQTMAYGPGESRFIEEKRHFEKPIPVNDNVFLDRERCILCDRCTRFADEVVGDPLIHFMDRGNQTQVNTFPDQPFASYFSGNVVQICPVGALTAKPYRFKARPWDLEECDSTYPNAMGDRINVQSSRDQVLRFQGLDSDAVNWGWLSDKERFAFEAFQSETRLREPLVRGGGLNDADPDGDELVAASWSSALRTVADAIESSEPERIGFIGGARMTNEAQYAWTKLAKGVVGTDNVDAMLGDELPAHAILGLPRATIAEACQSRGTIVLLGPDPKEQLGTLYIRLRHAVLQAGARLIELTPAATGLADVATVSLHARPGEVGKVARAMVSGVVDGDVGGVSADRIEQAHALLSEPVTVVVGRGSLAESVLPTLEAVDALNAIDGVSFLPAVRRGNTMGALDMGMAPGLLPGRKVIDSDSSDFSDAWPTVPAAPGSGTEEMLEAAAAGNLDVLFLLGADPVADALGQTDPAAALENVPTVVAVDLFANASNQFADVVLPATAFTESNGSHTNLEGRISPIRQKVTPPGTARPDWLIAADLASRIGSDLGFESAEAVWEEITSLSSVHDLTADEIEAAPDGVLVTGNGSVEFQAPNGYTEVEPLDAYSLRLATTRRMYDQGTIVQNCAHLAELAEPTYLRLNGYDFNRLGVSAGTPVSVSSATTSVQVPVVADDGVPKGVALIDHNRSGVDSRALLDSDAVSVDVRVETS
ncbi:MAG: NADH-quinone oxidoreductase subunit NuoG [Acidimicrobiales bacterium]